MDPAARRGAGPPALHERHHAVRPRAARRARAQPDGGPPPHRHGAEAVEGATCRAARRRGRVRCCRCGSTDASSVPAPTRGCRTSSTSPSTCEQVGAAPWHSSSPVVGRDVARGPGPVVARRHPAQRLVVLDGAVASRRHAAAAWSRRPRHGVAADRGRRQRPRCAASPAGPPRSPSRRCAGGRSTTGPVDVPTWDASSEAAQLLSGMFVEPGVVRTAPRGTRHRAVVARVATALPGADRPA